MESILIRIGVFLASVAIAFAAGMIKGCDHASAKYEQAETKFLVKTKELVKVETKEVVRVKTEIKTVHDIITQTVEAANAETPNPTSCDLSASRVQRINQTISSSRAIYDEGMSGDSKAR